MLQSQASSPDPHARQQLALAETFFNHSVSCLVILDRHYNFVRVNAAYARACRRDINDFVGHNHFDLYPSDTKAIFDEVVRTKRPFVTFTRAFEFAEQPERGVTYWDWTLVPVLDAKGEIEYLVFSLVEVTERKRADEALRVAALVYTHSSEAMMVTDADNRILAINDAFTQMAGYSMADVAGKNPRLFGSGLQDTDFYRAMWQALEQHGRWHGELTDRRKDGSLVAVRLSINTVYDEHGNVDRRVALFSDITDKQRAERMIWDQANIDGLTKLPNRHRFRECLDQYLKKAQRAGAELALLLIDLDQFKEINDTLGHDTGDLLLIDVARRIRDCLRPETTLARLGGDEFAIILDDADALQQLDAIARQIIAALTTPFKVGPEMLFISASIGIAKYPHDAQTIESLLRHADQAMYAAKNAGRNRYFHFTSALQEAAQRRMSLTNELRGALAAGQLEIFLQPIADVETGAIQKAEALLRWNHPSRGLVSPAEFIGLAESSGLIIEIGEWVFRQASSYLRHRRALGDSKFQISINVSPVQFKNDETLSTTWLGHLEQLDLPPDGLVIEITEGLLLDVTAEVRSKLFTLGRAGVQLALDDFGTGYSSLAYLKKFDIDYLKIDRVFVRNLEYSSDDLVLCEAMIMMAHKLGLKVIAEGVESKAQHAMLKSAGCDFIQGYLCSRPLPITQFEALLGQAAPAAPAMKLR
ncbi:EAL domain-containing protein [Duganella sp. FT92W]|uniref:EAL domain-containing protein n=1 Tax=Pseudoduganella rivuli TaxID=2666085 RepID=A0A7X2LQY2_9BURK|nr:EAL domain-containing protein [Pseudoduganella rivuli]MRV71850.1 EAL domain-containing protein [Pseudoduganella rivuli]